MNAKIPRIMFAAAASGSGKTTITCGVLRALLDKGLVAAAFKCGPDYIDPMFHSEVIGAKSRNLDLFLLSPEVCRYLLATNSAEADLALLEGVMGYYDGLETRSAEASSYHLAKVTSTPVVLIVDCSGASLSLAALVRGFVQFRQDSNIKAVILNHLSPSLYPRYQEMIRRETGLEVLGFFPPLPACFLESRHLGLVTAAEVRGLKEKIARLARQAEESVDLEGLLAIARQAPALAYQEFAIEKGGPATIAVARDKAFCFYYQDSLELLQRMGAEIIWFSPLEDQSLPACDGLILGGGYPELYAGELAKNTSMLTAIKTAIDGGLPCIAECGGYMYLLDSLADLAGQEFKLAGCLPGKAWMTEKLNRFGYIKLTALADNLLCKAGESIHAHEFHYADSSDNGSGFMAEKPGTGNGKTWNCIHIRPNLFAGYPHLHFWSNVNFASSFLNQCRSYRQQGRQQQKEAESC